MSSPGVAYNVRADFGAVGNGTTDDTTALASALSAAGTAATSATRGAVVALPPGDYWTSRKLTIPAGVTLRGAGKEATILRAGYDATTPAGEFLTGIVRLGDGGTRVCFGSRLEDLTVQGSDMCEVGIYTTQANEGCGVQRVRVRGCTQYPVRISRNGAAEPVADVKLLDSVEVWGMSTASTILAGVFVEASAGSLQFDDLAINFGTSAVVPDGVLVSGCGVLLMVNPHIEGCADAIDVAGSHATTQSGVILAPHLNHNTNGVHIRNGSSAKDWQIIGLRSENHATAILDDMTGTTLAGYFVANYTIGSTGVNVGATRVVSGVGRPFDLGYAGPEGTLYLNTDATAKARVWTRRNGTWLPFYTQSVKALTYAATVQPDLAAGNVFTISATDDAPFTITAPTSSDTGQPVTFDIANASAGPLGPIRWAPAYLLAGPFVNPAAGKRRTITFYRDTAGNYIETGRSAADI